MALSNAHRQRTFRQRAAAKQVEAAVVIASAGRMKTALEAIATRLAGNDKTLAVELRKLAEEGLSNGKA